MESYTFRRAVTQEEKEHARDLITKEYLRVGYIRPGSSESSLSKNLFLDTTVTFIALKEGRVVGTISIFYGDEDGLPMEGGWLKEVSLLREQGRTVAEIGQFAIEGNTSQLSHTFSLGPSLGLFKQVLAYGLESTLDGFCIAVHAKHERFYTMLGFTRMGDLRSYGPVDVASAAGMYLDLHPLRRGTFSPRSLLARLLLPSKSRLTGEPKGERDGQV